MSRPAASIQLNLSLWLSAAVLLAAAAAGILSFISMYREANDLQDQMLQQTAALINPAALPPRADNTDSDVRIHIQPLESSAPQHYALPARLSDGLHTISHDGDRYRVYVKTYPQGQRLAFIQETEFRDEAAYNSAWHAVAPLLLLLPVLTLLSIFTIRHMLRPMRQLSETLEHRPSSDLTPLPEARLPREVYGFVTAINRLLGRINEHMQQQQRFIADAAHELRTPLAVLRGELEAIQDGVRQFTPESVASLQAEVGTLTKLVDDLHQLSMSDEGALAYQKAPVDVINILEVISGAFRERFASRNLKIDLSLPDSAVVFGDKDRLMQLFNNLLENSLRYTDSGGGLHISGRQENGRFALTFADSAPGVQDAQLEKLFERFYRTEGSRNRASGGSGLGLAICVNIVEAHNGTIRAAHSPFGGVSITVELPLERDLPRDV